MPNIKPLYINDKTILINLSRVNCETGLEILDSKIFQQILKKFYQSIHPHSDRHLCTIKKVFRYPTDVIDIYKWLMVYDYLSMAEKHPQKEKVLKVRTSLVYFTEKLYDFWRDYERYGIIHRRYNDIHLDTSVLVERTTKVWKNVLTLYRQMLAKLIGKPIHVYRQTPGGFNAGFIVSNPKRNLPLAYETLNDINVIQAAIIRTPFIGHSKANTRQGVFQETEENILSSLKLTKRHWLCFPIWVGDLLAYVYFHRAFMHHGIALCNLFEPAFDAYQKGQRPDLVYVYGSHETEHDKTYYIDKENKIYFGYVSRQPENDYFGYMKKMLLTLHNLCQIDLGHLPIHGAMVNIVMNDNQEHNLVIIGDSGAGKSETLEALRYLADDKIKEMNVVFDDMGTFYEKDGQIYAKGTEIGAFIRLDDLDTGYAYKELDRAIFMNPERQNARVILPISTYDFIIAQHKVDYVLYANNYEDNQISLRPLDDMTDILAIFKQGKRKAKGTTAEMGLVTSYFANPFGPVQEQIKTDPMIDRYFERLKQDGIFIGELYTKLAVEGREKEGVIDAARGLLMLLE